MAHKTRLTAIATVALLFSIVTMFLLHTFGPLPSFMEQAGFNGTSAMPGMWSGMGWMMLFGPIAMILFFGGIVTLAVLLITSLLQSADKRD